MADQNVKVTITVTDNASREFAKISDGADRMGREIEESGKQAGRSFQDMERDLRNVGLGLGVLAAGVALSGRSFRDQEIAVANLSRSYGDAADEIERFVQQLEDTSNFSDESARAAANQVATLARNYGFTADEIERVLQISADLAALNPQIGLEQAAYRVTAALRGEAEGAEALGLTMNQQAIDRDNLTLTMSNQEAAHFRLNALIEQSTFAEGAAAEQAESTYGTMSNLAQSVTDAAQSFGEFLGPLGEVGAFAADNAIQIAAMGLALGQLGKAAVAINDISKAMTGMNLASAGLSSVVGLMTGPVGIVVAAGLAGLAIREFAGTIGPEFAQASDDAVESVDALIAKVVELGDTSALANVVLGLDTITASQQKLNDEANRGIGIIGELIAEAVAMDDANADTVEGLLLSSAAFDDFTQAQRDAIDANGDGVATLAELTAAQAEFASQAQTSKEVLEGLASGADELAAILTLTGEGAAFAKNEANAYTEALLAGQIGAADYERLLQDLLVGYGNTQEAALENTSAVDDNTAAYEDATTAVQRYLDTIRQTPEAYGTNVSAAAGVVGTLGGIQEAYEEAAASIQGYFDAEQQLAGSAAAAGIVDQTILANRQLDIAADNYNKISVEAARAATTIGEFGKKQLEIAAGAFNIPSVESALAGAQMSPYELQLFFDDQASAKVAQTVDAINTQFDELQTQFTQTSEALDTVFGAIVGNTNAIAKQSQDVADWSAGLTVATEHMDEWGNSLGWWSVADDLVYDLTISQEQYTAAVDANTQIQAANASIQRDVLSIQAQLAPVIATSTQALAAQMDEIAQGSTDAQLFALGMMDATTSSQALALAQSYLQDADTFGPMIQQAAELNPMLAQILEEMGLISYNPATGTVELLGAEESQSQLETLNDTLEKLAKIEVMIRLGLDSDEADAWLAEHGFGPAGTPIEQELLVTLMPQYSVAADADPATVIGEALPQYPIDAPVDVNVIPNFIIGGAPGGGGAGIGAGIGGAADFGFGELSVNVAVTADTSGATSAIGEVTGALQTIGGTTTSATIDADNSGAIGAVDEATSTLSGWDSSSGEALVEADNGGATQAISSAQSQLSAWDSSSGSAAVNAQDNASGVIASVAGSLAALDGQTATTYINTVYTTTGAPPIALGGVVSSHALGNVVPAQLAEVGPELLHFPNGGLAIAKGPGIYPVPSGTYVNNAPATDSVMRNWGGSPINIYISGVTDWEETTRQVTRRLVPAIQRATNIHLSGYPG